MALTEIGEVLISDARAGGEDYFFRPTFEAMTRIGDPEEIVSVYAKINGDEARSLISSSFRALGYLPAWITPQLHLIGDRLLTSAMRVLQACCEKDLTPLIGEWKGWSRYVVYRPGLIPKDDIILIAQHLMLHGVIGKAKIRKLQRHENNETTSEFRAFDYISAARAHFGMSREEASRLTMTEFILLLAQKFPDQKGFTREEYDKVADDFLAKQAARRAASKK
ncbi:DUF6246 family protein [Kosakonia sacchari]|uniref:DUF6246 family protein n=1 Tax=Kosakonia sacchari TaxID=1158459 RepID=UPI0015854A7D|nr:DUF6246 family protein [Kosakonia sacchari]NUL36642.1 hypothetical protein [Kosakonia sacchari]